MRVYATQGDSPTAVFLRQSGLEDELIAKDDWNAEGFLAVHLKDGQPVYWGKNYAKGAVLVYKPWPEGFDLAKWREIVGEG